MESQIQSFILTQFQLERLASLARDSLPNESCALLLGNNTNKENEIQVIETLSMKNSDASPTTRFRIDSQELINGYLRAEKMGLNVIGIFHSHPAPPFPSSTDKIFMEINPIVWLIYSTLTNESRAYIFEQKKIREVRLSVIKE
ncbi:MAG TPA: M67 family metallopeptidase [Nitrososphaeraceae archaeon]|jgi:proteasome lid subunit RPN8/RPN11|nr:M67 family metallopeptidase [Nitrososphaeraceae archaeon]